jgi:TfoX/Sxy family transcriptional regulator of competence genes
MAYDRELAERIREVLREEDGITEMSMFGGLGFMVEGNMAVAASGEGGLLLRVGAADADALVEEPHADRASMRGREMRGWLRIEEAGVASGPALRRWVRRGVTFARTLPPK